MASPRKQVKRTPDRGPAPRPVDPTDILPSIPKGEFRHVMVVSTKTWFDNWQLHNEGEEYEGTFPIDKDGDLVLPPHVVLAGEYEAPTIDLPATNLSRDSRNRARVRGGASGMPNL